MTSRVCMGNEAIALGAVRAGIKVASGYPGTPSTEILETLVREKNSHSVNVEWSTNEKSALEVAAGAAYTRARSLVTMKQVGLNVASDPLMSLAYIGVQGGMVIVVADDPGPWSSQTEQDTRSFAKYANLPVFDPSSPEEAYLMIQAAFDLSEEFNLPVILRPTTRVCHASASVEIDGNIRKITPEGFEKDPKWCIFPALSYRRHGEIEIKQGLLSEKFSSMEFNSVTGLGKKDENPKKGIAVSGISYLYAKEIIDEYSLDVALFKVGTPYPLPEKMALDFISSLDSVLVIEELDPVVEEQMLILAKGRIPVTGKRTGDLPYNGEYSYELVKRAIFKYLQIEQEEESTCTLPELPMRPPVLCAGCPHRASFYEAKVATKNAGKVVYCGDIGCYTLGNAAPLNMTDTCLCMGGGITIAQGIKKAEPDTKCMAFIGDSTFFHTGIAGVINAVYQKTDITIVVLDNHTTAMTGNQPHPGTGFTAMGEKTKALDIEMMLRACGVEEIYTVNPFDYEDSVEAFKKAVAYEGPSAVITKAPCIANIKKPKTVFRVNENCIGCGKCIKQIGCPAITPLGVSKVVIDESICTDCGLCTNVCPVGAIKRGERCE